MYKEEIDTILSPLKNEITKAHGDNSDVKKIISGLDKLSSYDFTKKPINYSNGVKQYIYIYM